MRQGVLLTVIFVSVSAMLVNAIAFTLPIMQQPYEQMRWAHLTYFLASVPLIPAIWKLTAPPPMSVVAAARTVLRAILFLSVVLLVLGRAARAVVGLIDSPPNWPVWNVKAFGLWFAAVFTGCFYMDGVCRALGLRGLGNRFYHWALMLIVIWVLDLVAQFELEYYSWRLILFTTLVLASVYSVGLWLLLRVRRHMGYILDGRCGRCGYQLLGITEPRCPECAWWAPSLFS